MSESIKSSSKATKPAERQAKQSLTQTANAPVQELGLGLSDGQMAMHHSSMSGQAALLDRLHPPQRTAMVQRMMRTHSNSQLSQIIARTQGQQPQREAFRSEPSQFQIALTRYGMNTSDLSSKGAVSTHEPISRQAPSARPIQAKMTVNEVDDPYEQEADQVADQVMRQAAAPAEPPPPSDDGLPNDTPPTNGIAIVQRAPDSDPIGGMAVGPDIESRVNQLNGGGEPLSDSSREFFESRMGADFGDVRIHRDASSAELSQDINARAFTVGNNIAFNSGEYNPGTSDGDRLLAHELTHTVQQGAAGELQREPQEAGADQSEMAGMSLEEIEAARELAQDPAVNNPESELIPQVTPPPSPPSLPNIDIAQQLDGGLQGVQQNLTSITAQGAGELPSSEAPSVDELLAANDTSSLIADLVAGSRGGGESELAQEQDKAVAMQAEAMQRAGESAAQAANVTDSKIEFQEVDIEGLREQIQSQSEMMVQRQHDPDKEPIDIETLIESKREAAQGLISTFQQNASQGTQTLTNLSESIPEPIQNSADAAKDILKAAYDEQTSVFTTAISDLRSKVASESGTLKTDLLNEYIDTVGKIADAASDSKKVAEGAYTDAVEDAKTLKEEKLGELNDLYCDGEQWYHDAGGRVAEAAEGIGGPIADHYAGLVRSPKVSDGVLDGPVTDNRNEARAEAARSTTNQYKDSYISQATTASASAKTTQPDSEKKFDDIVIKYEQLLEDFRDDLIRQIGEQAKLAKGQAKEKFTALSNQIDAAEGAANTSLDTTEIEQQKLIDDAYTAQTDLVDSQATQATARLQTAVSDAVLQMTTQVAQATARLAAIDIPHVANLEQVLSEADAEIASAIAAAETEIATVLAEIEVQLIALATDGAGTIKEVADTAVTVVTGIETTFTQSKTDTETAIIADFEEIRGDNKDALDKIEEGIVGGFEKTNTDFKNELVTLYTGVETILTDAVCRFEEGLTKAMNGEGESIGLKQAIDDSMDQAAAAIKPRWQKVLKWVCIILVVVVVAFVAGPFIMGAIGALITNSIVAAMVGGAIVGALTSGAIQIVSNLFDGNKWNQGLGLALLTGAIGGAFSGGLMEGLFKPLINKAVTAISGRIMKAVTNYALETTADFVINVFTEFLIKFPTDTPMNGEDVIKALITSMISTGVSQHPRTQSFTNGIQEHGATFGTKVKNAFTGSGGTTTPTPTAEGGNAPHAPGQSNQSDVDGTGTPQDVANTNQPQTEDGTLTEQTMTEAVDQTIVSDNAPPEVDSKVVPKSDGTYRLNRKDVDNLAKIDGQPDSTTYDDAAREAYAAELAAGRSNVERVYMGKEAEAFLNNGPNGGDLTADVIAVTKKGQYVLSEASGSNIEDGLIHLEHTADVLGKEQVIRYNMTVPDQIQPGYRIDSKTRQLLTDDGSGNYVPYLIHNKPVYVYETTPSTTVRPSDSEADTEPQPAVWDESQADVPEVFEKVVPRSDGTYRINRKRVDNLEKIQGQPDSTTHAEAAMEAHAAELAANRSNVDRVYLGQDAEAFINNGPQGDDMACDVVAVTKNGQYALSEGSGSDIEDGLLNLEHSANELGKEQVIRYNLSAPDEIQAGYQVDPGSRQLMFDDGDGNYVPYLIHNKPVYVYQTGG